MNLGETRDQSLSPFVARIADAQHFKGGSWRANAHGSAAGGFIVGASSAPVKAPAKVDFASVRPNVGKEERAVIACVLDRAPVDEFVATEMISSL